MTGARAAATVAGWAFGLAALVCLGAEAFLFFTGGVYEVLTLGRVLADHAGSVLDAARATAAGHGPVVDALLAELLALPGWTVAGVPAAALLWASGRGAAGAACEVPAREDP